MFELAKADLTTLSSFLGDKDYFFGKDPHTVSGDLFSAQLSTLGILISGVFVVVHLSTQLDLVAFAHLAQFVYVPIAGLKEWMESDTPNLLALVERFKAKHWTDWDEICSTHELNTHLPKKELSPEALEAKKEEDAKKEEAEKKKAEKKRLAVSVSY